MGNDLIIGHLSLVISHLSLLCGEASEAKGQAQPLIDELTKRYPKDTLINSIWLPAIRAAIEINRNKEAKRAYEKLK